MPDVSAAILVGGQARRFEGRLKAALPVGGESILTRQLIALAGAGIDRVMLVGRWKDENRPSAPVIADAVATGGALTGVYTALLAAPTDVVVVLASDLPFVTAPLLARLARPDRDDEVVVPHDARGRHPLCAGYRRRVARRLKARIDRGDWSVRAALEDLQARDLDAEELARLGPDGTMLMNVNTPFDYEHACREAIRGAQPRG